ncbi:hypothetical protein QBC47DRAFT_426993 [Echria macrotheca]|uniref:Uncharacterized protein n=1 Tax=Echria macrotheca TaxID=438768 RepID=A0AAJ0FFN9_9PEZI|nr:hypothetical protein QBC47DRAFT_426993 [Echria macrotheca]
MPSNLRPNRAAVPYQAKVLPRDLDSLRDRLNEVSTRPDAARDVKRYAACRTAAGDKEAPGHPVMTGDIFEWSVKTDDAWKMMRAFELQWALIRIVAIAGGAGPHDGDDRDDYDRGLAVKAWIDSLPEISEMEHLPIPEPSRS